ncbi:MAG: GNAT family N-acetyltransferase [Anaerolineae bacterium]|jgi:ribosomal protein S18 acetylase RimI-like enzyme|nr:GNAT family N-acetyltransferase [Anaerolineae bacterium]
MEIAYHQITSDDILHHETGLIALIQDAVADGASIGFIAPMSDEDARAYWKTVQSAVASGDKVIFIALDEHQRVAGSIQLGNATFPNGHHRAEVQKLLVHRDYRNRGIAKTLLNLIEQKARDMGKWLLVLDTVEGSVAQGLYLRSGYVQAGIIPEYALSSAGPYEATVVFYKNLKTGVDN